MKTQLKLKVRGALRMAGFVGSPMSDRQMAKASDEEIFRMIDEIHDHSGGTLDLLLGDSSERRQGLIDQDFVAIAVALQRSSGDQRARAMNLCERLLDAGNYYADRAARDSVIRA